VPRKTDRISPTLFWQKTNALKIVIRKNLIDSSLPLRPIDVLSCKKVKYVEINKNLIDSTLPFRPMYFQV